MPPIRMICLIMRAPFRFIAVPCGVLVLSAFVARLPAQQPTGKAASRPPQSQSAQLKTDPAPKNGPVKQAGGQAYVGDKPARPPATPMIVEPLSPELEAILGEWERRSAQIKSLKGKHTRTVYNLVFEVEKRAEGRFFLETPDKGRIDLNGVEIKKNTVSVRSGKSGNPFRVESDRSEKWICNGEEILMINEEDKSYDIVPLPKELRGTNIVKGPLPFLFGIKAEDAKRRFSLSLSDNNPDPASQYAILVVPLLLEDQQNYKKAKIFLDKKTFLPRQVMLLDPTENLQTSYIFEIQDINNRNKLDNLGDWFGGDRDPYHPELKKKGYKIVVRTDPAAAKGSQPVNGASRPGEANTSRTGTGGQPSSNTQQATRPGTSSLGTPRK